MNVAYNTLRNRLNEVIEETLHVMSAEVRAGRVTSDAAVDKVQHLINLVRKFPRASDDHASDQEDAPSSPGDAPSMVQTSVTTSIPDVLTLETAPAVGGFISLSFGLVNLLQVALLDVNAKQLYMAGGIIRNLSEADTTKLRHWSQLYQLNPKR